MTYTKTRFDGYNLYFTAHCGRANPREPVHAHVSYHSRESGSAKLWVYLNGSSDVKEEGGVPARTLNKVRKWIAENYVDMFRQWYAEFHDGFVMTIAGGQKAIEIVLMEIDDV